MKKDSANTFHTYILYSESTERYYTGSTSRLKARIQQHNNGKSSSTKHGRPWKLIWSKQASSRSEAMRLENKIKKRGAKRFLHDRQQDSN